MFIKIFFFHSLVFFRGFQRKKDTSEFQNIKKIHQQNQVNFWLFNSKVFKSSLAYEEHFHLVASNQERHRGGKTPPKTLVCFLSILY